MSKSVISKLNILFLFAAFVIAVTSAIAFIFMDGRTTEASALDTDSAIPTGKSDSDENELGGILSSPADIFAKNFDAQAPCWAQMDYSPYDLAYMNIIEIGDLWGQIYLLDPTEYQEAGADAYYDSGTGDCGWSDYAGILNRNVGTGDGYDKFELYVPYAVAMDHDAWDNGYFQFRIFNVYECTSSCTSGCTNTNVTFTDYARTGTDTQRAKHLFRYSINLPSQWCGTNYNYDSLCIPRVRIDAPNTSGWRYYRYTIQAKACFDGSCSSGTTKTQEGCFKIQWL